MLDKLKVAFVLVVIGAISGFLIYGTNELTADTISENRYNQELDFYREIFELTSDFVFTVESTQLENGLTEVVLLDSNQETIGYVYKGSDTNNYGDITVLVGITLEGNIKNVVISQATNTPTFVKKIKDKYLPNFVGQDVDSVNYDQRTGATHTYNSVSEVVELATTYFASERGVSND
jgi:electron transport complex protein RnfG